MSLLDAMSISASGLTAQRERLEVTVANLANARTTRTAEGGPYRRRDVVFEAQRLGSSFAEELEQSLSRPMGVRVVGVSFDPRPPEKAYDPGHPDADADGFVSFPNVSPVEEVVNLVSTARSFEANLAALNVTRQLVQGSIEIGRS